MELNQLGTNTSRKQMLVFVNRLLQIEGIDYEWDSIDEVPIFKSELSDKDFVCVMTIDPLFGCARKDYQVENPSNPKFVGGDVTIISGRHSEENGGNITITAQDDGYSLLTIGDEDVAGGDVIITAGYGYSGARSGQVIIRSDSSIHLDAPQVFVGPKEEQWPMSSTSEKN